MKELYTSIPGESQEKSEKNNGSKVLKTTKDYRIDKIPLYNGHFFISNKLTSMKYCMYFLYMSDFLIWISCF